MKALLLFLLMIDLSLSGASLDTLSNTRVIVSQTDYRYKIQFYASSDNDTIVAELKTLKWFNFECNICLNQQVEHENSIGNCKNKKSCDKEKFNEIWLSRTCNCCPPPPSTTSTKTNPATASTTTTPFAHSTQKCQISVEIFSTVIGLLTLLLILVITGWVCTCWKLKKDERSSSSIRGEQNTELYANSSFGKDTTTMRYQPSTGYSLLNQERNTHSENNIEEEMKDTYSVLDRSHGRAETRKNETHQRGELDGYSELSWL